MEFILDIPSNLLFNLLKFFFFRIKRTGKIFELFISDDKISWVLVKTVTLASSVPESLRWGIFFDVSTTPFIIFQDTETMSAQNVEFEGFGLCGSGGIYSYATQSCSTSSILIFYSF